MLFLTGLTEGTGQEMTADRKNRFKKIGVLMGGDSGERKISLKSAEAVIKALKNKGYKIKELVVDELKSLKSLIKSAKVDCIFIALHGGFGEDGRVQAVLDEMQIPYTGSGPEASSRAMDKIVSKKILQENGLPVPPYKVLEIGQNERFGDELGLPLVVKPSGQGSSLGLTIVDEKNNLKKAIKKAFDYDSEVIIERYIEGREITVGILNDKPLPVLEIKTSRKFYDYQAKYTGGKTRYLVPAPIEKELYSRIQQLGLKTHKLLECNFFSRVDMRLSPEGQVFILEANSIPGLTSKSLLPKAAREAGISFEEMCQMITEAASCGKSIDQLKREVV
jgi:D-alanine-D-alanine ligase